MLLLNLKNYSLELPKLIVFWCYPQYYRKSDETLIESNP